MKLHDLAQRLGGQLENAAKDAEITGVAGIEEAASGILAKKRGRPRKDEHETEEFVAPRRRRFAIKKVTQIKTKKEK